MSGTDRIKTIVIFGPTGVAGSGVLQACLADPRIDEVRSITRRELDIDHPKLHEVQCDDFSELDGIAGSLTGIDAVCFCLGRAVSQVSGEAEYRVITYDFSMAAARATQTASPDATFHFLSGSGTNGSSRMMWARVKGETEKALGELDLGGLICWRPAMILADRPPKGLPLSYRLAYPIFRLLRASPSLSIRAHELGQAMLQETFNGRREGIVENREIRSLARTYGTTRHGKLG